MEIYLEMLAFPKKRDKTYVNYSDIQVLMMVTETETFKSTLIHNKFTYLDYFFLSSYCRILIHIYFHTVLSEKQIPNTFLHDI